MTFLLAGIALAEEVAGLPPEARVADVQPRDDVGDELRFIGVFSARGVMNNITTENPLLNGQLVGELGGENSTTTQEDAGAFTEERLGAFFTYTPAMLGGRASLDAAFEVDFAWGDQSYSIGGNTGGAFGADQVNLQTRRLSARVQLLPGHSVVGGLQFVGDSVNDPGTSRLDDLTRSGGRLMFFGSEAAGVAAYGKFGDAGGERVRYRAGVFTLYEQAFADGDDVTLMVADVQVTPAYAGRIGAHGWFLRDRAGGDAGLAGSGPASALSELQGGPRLDFRGDDEVAPEVDADIFWAGLDGGYNPALDLGPVGVHAVAVINTGKIYVQGKRDYDVLGLLANVEARWRFAPGSGSVARLELMGTTGDADTDQAYTGVLTGNTWGVVGAFHSTHGCYLLFPDGGSVNRAVSVVPDVSAAGRGMLAATGSVGFDFVPERLNATVGAGHARTSVGLPLGSEVNLRVSARPFTLGTFSLVGATAFGTALPHNPWAAMITFDWLVLG